MDFKVLDNTFSFLPQIFVQLPEILVKKLQIFAWKESDYNICIYRYRMVFKFNWIFFKKEATHKIALFWLLTKQKDIKPRETIYILKVHVKSWLRGYVRTQCCIIANKKLVLSGKNCILIFFHYFLALKMCHDSSKIYGGCQGGGGVGGYGYGGLL